MEVTVAAADEEVETERQDEQSGDDIEDDGGEILFVQFVVSGDQVIFESERKRVKKTISLEEYPALRNFVDAFRASFTGDAAQLKQVYETRLEGSRWKWVLVLRPHDPAGKAIVDSIQFSGSEGRLATIIVRASDGDRSVMTLSRGHVP